jgi:hypothetical protein
MKRTWLGRCGRATSLLAVAGLAPRRTHAAAPDARALRHTGESRLPALH